MKEYAVRTEHLQKMYKNQKALDSVSIHIEKGSIYGLIGKNGAGKTTLMKMITGIAYPTDGDIFLFEQDIKVNRHNVTRLGNLIEMPGLYPNMCAFDNMRLQAIAMGVYNKKRIQELLELVGIAFAGKKKVKNYSMGMKLRLGIAMALIGSPDMLILDEPINGLDPQGIIEVRELLLKLCHENNLTILISSHILDELSKIATHYGIINSGNLIMEITAKELKEKCAEKLEIITGDTAKAGTALEAMGITDYTVMDTKTIHVFSHIDKGMEINQKLILSNVPVSSIRIKSDSLEEFFLKTTSEDGGRNND